VTESELKLRFNFCYLGLAAMAALIIAIGAIVATANPVTRKQVASTVQAAVGPDNVAVAAKEYLAGQAANQDLLIKNAKVLKETAYPGGKEVVRVRATVSDQEGDQSQKTTVDVTLTKGKWQGQSIQQAQ
jgi:hypothetical protein